MKVYLCSPLRAPTEQGRRANMLAVRRICEENRRSDIRLYAPHAWLPEFIDDSIRIERDLALEFGKKVLLMCDVVAVLGDHLSDGMRGEIELAVQHLIPIVAADNGLCPIKKEVLAYVNQIREESG